MEFDETKSLSNLREAKSTPFLHPLDSNSKAFKSNKNRRFYSTTQLSLRDANYEPMEKTKKIFFNAGCSSSSTEINRLMQFYNDSADPNVVAHWMRVYEEHKLKCRQVANENKKNFLKEEELNGDMLNENVIIHGSFESCDSLSDEFPTSLPKYRNLNKYENLQKMMSQENYLKKLPCQKHLGSSDEIIRCNKNCNDCLRYLNDDYARRHSIGFAFNRSLDDFTNNKMSVLSFKLPNKLNFEKCASADFRSNNGEVKEKKLERCKEMLNIAAIGKDAN
uniref:Uncharacterized protein n=1 Tax=Parastrongyloides trichosuri TaxID=131310 RepID=A0A0N4Z379_PARTI